MNVHELLNVIENVRFGQVEFGKEIAGSVENVFHVVFARHLVEIAGYVVGVHFGFHDVFAIFDKHGKAHEQEEWIVQFGQRIDELFLLEVMHFLLVHVDTTLMIMMMRGCVVVRAAT